MAIKNYTTRVAASKTIGEIQSMLAKHGAFRVSIDYGEGASVLGITFALNDMNGKPHVFKLPARVDAVKAILKRQRVKCSDEHAEMVAWRNIKDWVDAQIALIETGQANMTEIMLPYMLNGSGKTLYESLLCRALPEGDAS